MRVCLDARSLRDTVTGIGRYAEQLIRALAAIDRTTDYVIILSPHYHGTIVRQENFSTVRLPSRPERVRNLFRGAGQIKRLRADIYHALFHFLPFGVGGRAVLTLHDLNWIEHPDAWAHRSWGYAVKAYSHITMGYALRRADHVIAISEYTAARARAVMGVPLARMTVIPHGVEQRFFRPEVEEEAAPSAAQSLLPEAPFKGPERRPFFLVVGHSSPHKNCGRIVGAMALLAQRIPEIDLLFVGRGEGYDGLRAQASSLGLRGRVHLVRSVPDEQLLAFYRKAIALVMPSLVEGFGLPVLEAQAAGCPVVTSSQGALAETAGDAALLVDPFDSWDIARAMELVHRNSELRASLIQRGLERARAFTWEATATRTRKVYDLLMDGSASWPSDVGDRLVPQPT